MILVKIKKTKQDNVLSHIKDLINNETHIHSFTVPYKNDYL